MLRRNACKQTYPPHCLVSVEVLEFIKLLLCDWRQHSSQGTLRVRGLRRNGRLRDQRICNGRHPLQWRQRSSRGDRDLICGSHGRCGGRGSLHRASGEKRGRCSDRGTLGYKRRQNYPHCSTALYNSANQEEKVTTNLLVRLDSEKSWPLPLH